MRSSAFSVAYLPVAGTDCCTQYSPVLTFVLMAVVLAFRPQGIFGTRELWDLPFVRRLLRGRLAVAAAPAGASPVEVRDDSNGPKGVA